MRRFDDLDQYDRMIAERRPRIDDEYPPRLSDRSHPAAFGRRKDGQVDVDRYPAREPRHLESRDGRIPGVPPVGPPVPSPRSGTGGNAGYPRGQDIIVGDEKKGSTVRYPGQKQMNVGRDSLSAKEPEKKPGQIRGVSPPRSRNRPVSPPLRRARPGSPFGRRDRLGQLSDYPTDGVVDRRGERANGYSGRVQDPSADRKPVENKGAVEDGSDQIGRNPCNSMYHKKLVLESSLICLCSP